MQRDTFTTCITAETTRKQVFFNRENYLFFLEKFRVHIRPHADVLGWCLMPNHFHWMFAVKQVEVQICGLETSSPEFDPMTWEHRINNQDSNITHPMNPSHRMSNKGNKEPAKFRSLNDSIAIMLRSYTRAINKQYQKHGSLFEQHTKALCLTESQGVSPVYFNTHFGMMGNLDTPETNYLNVCFDYIHQNPVSGKLVANPEDWEFSSYRDYYCGRKGKLVNRELAKE